jgi:hypothetical protein
VSVQLNLKLRVSIRGRRQHKSVSEKAPVSKCRGLICIFQSKGAGSKTSAASQTVVAADAAARWPAWFQPHVPQPPPRAGPCPVADQNPISSLFRNCDEYQRRPSDPVKILNRWLQPLSDRGRGISSGWQGPLLFQRGGRPHWRPCAARRQGTVPSSGITFRRGRTGHCGRD